MKKIGIITHHYVKNYGAFLQAYSLISEIEQMDSNKEVELINLIVPTHYLLNLYRRFKYSSDRKIEWRLWKCLGEFEHKLPTSKLLLSKRQFKNYTKIIIGSDEVWNYADILAYHPYKFGYGIKNIKTYSYAASAGQVNYNGKIPRKVAVGIQGLSEISVRDENTRKLVEKVTSVRCKMVLDPTLIHNFACDNNISNQPLIEGKYILLYGCYLTEDQKKVLTEYASERNMKIIGAGEYVEFADNCKDYVYTPFEWVNLYKFAELIITGTFHGLMFAISFRKNFLCMPKFQNRINKTKTILEKIDLLDRLYPADESATIFRQILDSKTDYINSEEVLKELQNESKAYLQSIVNS